MKQKKLSFNEMSGKLSRSEMKAIFGGTKESGGSYSCACRCRNGATVICPESCGTSLCFERVYTRCEGSPAEYCVTG